MIFLQNESHFKISLLEVSDTSRKYLPIWWCRPAVLAHIHAFAALGMVFERTALTQRQTTVDAELLTTLGTCRTGRVSAHFARL